MNTHKLADDSTSTAHTSIGSVVRLAHFMNMFVNSLASAQHLLPPRPQVDELARLQRRVRLDTGQPARLCLSGCLHSPAYQDMPAAVCRTTLQWQSAQRSGKSTIHQLQPSHIRQQPRTCIVSQHLTGPPRNQPSCQHASCQPPDLPAPWQPPPQPSWLWQPLQPPSWHAPGL